MRYVSVGLQEKNPRSIELTAHGTASHGSVPQNNNAIVHLANAVAAIGRWRAPIRLNETTREFFTRLAAISNPDDAARYRAVIGTDAARVQAADDYLFAHQPEYSSMLRTSLSPTMMSGGFRIKDLSKLGTTVNGKPLPSSLASAGDGVRDLDRWVELPDRARIGLAGIVFLDFERTGSGT